MALKPIQIDLVGLLQSIETHGTDCAAYRFFIYAMPGGEKSTLEMVKARLRRLIAAGHTTLPSNCQLLFADFAFL